MNALGTVPGHNDAVNVHELQQIVRLLKNQKAADNGGIPSEVYKFKFEGLQIMMSIFLFGCMLTGVIENKCLLCCFVFVWSDSWLFVFLCKLLRYLQCGC